MIQQTNARQRRGPSVSDEGLETWGSWSGRKYYSLQVAQHPLRARMCGFGDKDRRPLAPAAVAKMIVRRDDNSLVDSDDIDSSFFIVTVDLWSADGKQEMNLVLHPSSTDRYAPPPPHSTPGTTKQRRKGTTTSMGPPVSSSSSSSANPMSSVSPAEPPFTPTTPPTWGYPSWSQNDSSGNDMGYRPWNNSEPTWGQQQQQQSYNLNFDYAQGASVYVPATPTVPSMANLRPPYLHPYPNYNTPAPAPASSVPPPRHTYTRTLVGPLSANATRLLDEHRKPGIFFLFQDLSVRTEGTFRLRMRLMNIGRFPAPEAGATGVMSIDDPDDGHGTPGVSPVLAQVYTEPFTVYSAKRFPGVPDTTALSIAFGNQGQKLPLRNRNGSTSGGKRRRADDDDGESDSD
ncbi:velvet factor [Rhodocollybia butyracea]|uniref:Velvet factor n=1 Tax=Rhodocollybia butyracea TaxID=206335 RepID=A0A9P5Q999_9AGAR|nr:velvet factor [Rhodocollybia butyracea]